MLSVRRQRPALCVGAPRQYLTALSLAYALVAAAGSDEWGTRQGACARAACGAGGSVPGGYHPTTHATPTRIKRRLTSTSSHQKKGGSYSRYKKAVARLSVVGVLEMCVET